jgi:MYXO-CTERM domain-containing protein
MFKLGRKLAVLGAVAMSIGFAAPETQALRITEKADFFLGESSRIGTAAPPLTDIIRLTTTANQGGLYTNTYGFAGPGTVEVRTIGAALLNQAVPSDVGGVIVSPLGTNNDVTVIFALQGTAPAALAPGNSSETVLLGKAIVIDTGSIFPTAGSFNPHDPSTWGYAGLDAGNVLAVYNLDPLQDKIVTGANGDSKILPASGTNQLAFSDASVPLRTLNGETLWDYAGTPPTSDLLGDIPGPLGADPTREFQEVKDIQGDPLYGEGLIISNNGEVVDPVALTDGVGGGEETLNTIFSDFLSIGDFSSFSDLGPLVDLADYNPTNLPSQTGDFFANFDFVARPISTSFIPEPATALLGVLGLAGLARRRRRQA